MTDKRMPKYQLVKQEIMAWLQSGKLKPNDQMPTEHEIADRFQVSRQTVRQTLGELEQEGWLYRLQGKGTFVSMPRGAAVQEVQTIGMITTHISDYIFPHIVRGAESTLRSRGYGLLLSSTDNSKEKEKESLMMMLGKPLNGLIMEPTKSARGNPNLEHFLAMQHRNIPLVMINARYPEMSCPCVKVDDESGAFKAAEHLIGMGHTRIAGFFKIDDLQGVNRLKGFMRAHQQYGIPLSPGSVVTYETDDKNAKPFQAALAMLDRSGRPTAFVCYNDELAVHLLGAVRQVGLTIPGDLSMVGFDDATLATATEVQLTTLTHPKAEMGTKAVEVLLSMIDGRTLAGEDIVFEPELVVRDSVRRI
ncbi:GntR family transcriptional regulator [Paenibacillus xerothermodurans]|uniref:GntR family transcriptional regulator n=1 Tax=Paenibacillus xerothermodurans TaxID=1977292 RepID=A0A2W1N6J2_PAEXE|nr:GntR family transcriptional regulator [Paenibacillus xerothermodurans]PZE20007.1 GntR family transcriptional regulator [Paenibacillus xerothermodurans]